jgi:hypothetical protein
MSVSQQLAMSKQTPTTVSPFGGLPFRIAGGRRGGLYGGYTNPLSQAFGFGGGPGWERFQRQLGGAEGPLASFIRQATPVTEQYMPSLAGLAPEIERGARSAYGGYQSAIDQFMQQLPGFQATAGEATGGGREALGLARRYAEEAFSPLQGRAMFQEASRRALAPAREAAAARGMLEGGQAQAGEQQLLSDLAFQALQNEQANQQAAISGLGQAGSNLAQLATGQAGLAGLGPQMAGALFAAQPELAQMLQGARGLPLGAAQNLMGFLAGAQEPSMALLRMVLPTVATKGKSFSGGGSVGLG